MIAFAKTVCLSFLTASTLLLLAQTSQAQTVSATPSPVQLLSEAKIERLEQDGSGKEKTVLREPKDVVVVPGDQVIFTLSVINTGSVPAAGFRATNPMPAAVAFVAVSEEWAEVSVDNAANWGKLANLTVKAKSGDTGVETVRAAASEDVTHVRWIFNDAIAPGSKRTLSYRGVVK